MFVSKFTLINSALYRLGMSSYDFDRLVETMSNKVISVEYSELNNLIFDDLEQLFGDSISAEKWQEIDDGLITDDSDEPYKFIKVLLSQAANEARRMNEVKYSQVVYLIKNL